MIAMRRPVGWIPYEDRTRDQKYDSDKFKAETPTFREVNGKTFGAGDRPARCLLYDLETKVLGKRANRYGQYEGSCVGVSAARAFVHSQIGDAAVRGTAEDVRDVFPFATWGIGRRYAGLNRRGAGSYGAAQAKAGRLFGYIDAKDPKVPRFEVKQENWLWYSSKIELDYSVPKNFPVPEGDLAPLGKKTVHVAQIQNTDELADALIQGYGATMASNFGTRPRVKDGVLLGDWNDNWPHQMSISGYLIHESLGRIWPWDNQWSADAHPRCPLLSEMGIFGSFWTTDATMQRIIDSSGAECFVYGDTENWEVREIDWEFFFG